MPISILFWTLFILWVVLAFFYPGLWVNLLLVALVALLGVKTFGFIIQG